MREGAGGLRGISTSAEQVAIWVGSFSVCAHLDLTIEAMYCHEDAGRSHLVELRVNARRNKHKEGGESRQKMDEPETAMRLRRSCRGTRTLSM